MTLFLAKVAWCAGIVGWYVIRYPYQRRARRIGVASKPGGGRERALVAISFYGLFVVPAIYVMTGQPMAADYAFPRCKPGSASSYSSVPSSCSSTPIAGSAARGR